MGPGVALGADVVGRLEGALVDGFAEEGFADGLRVVGRQDGFLVEGRAVGLLAFPEEIIKKEQRQKKITVNRLIQ